MDTTVVELPVVSFIYKFIVGDNWYIGSSKTCIANRMKEHYRKAIECPTRKVYKVISEHGGWKNVKVEIITSFSFTTKEDLWREEDKFINLKDPLCLNTSRAILTEDERIQQKREVSSRCKKKKYYEDRKDPDWVEKTRERARALYAKQKQDPEIMKRKREQALASYHRRQAAKKKSC